MQYSTLIDRIKAGDFDHLSIYLGSKNEGVTFFFMMGIGIKLSVFRDEKIVVKAAIYDSDEKLKEFLKYFVPKNLFQDYPEVMEVLEELKK